MTKYVLYETSDYKDWFETQSLKSQRQIQSRILNIEFEGHFGNHKYLENGIWELKFNDGRRIYYAVIPPAQAILLLGGNKNGQDKDIKKATKTFAKIKELRSR